VHFSFSTFFGVSRDIPSQTMLVSHFPRLSVFLPYSRSTVCISHFPSFSVFLAIFHILQCVCLILHLFHCFLPYSRFYSRHFLFFNFSVFSPYFTCSSLCFSIFMILRFLDIIQALQCAFLIFHIFFQFSRHIPGLQCAFLIFQVFQSFSPYSRSYSVCPILNVFQFSRDNPCPVVCISHFSIFLAVFQVLQFVFLISHDFEGVFFILQVLQCAFLICHVIECFLPYSRSNSICVSFFTFFSVSHHIPSHTVFEFHFPRFSVFRHNQDPTVYISNFSHLSVCLAIFQVLHGMFLIFKDFSRFSQYSRSCSVHFYFSTFLSISCGFPGQTVFVSHFQHF
jgi:hypothetical protein